MAVVGKHRKDTLKPEKNVRSRDSKKTKQRTIPYMKSFSADQSPLGNNAVTFNTEIGEVNLALSYDDSVDEPRNNQSNINPSRSVSLPNLKEHTTRQHRPQHQRGAKTTVKQLKKTVKLPDISTSHAAEDYQKPLSFQKDLIKPSTRGYIRRATYLSKSLGELYAKRKTYDQPPVKAATTTQKSNFALYTQ